MIVIEAKGFEGFSSKQNAAFAEDRSHLLKLLGPEVQVHIVALASSAYVNSSNLRKETLTPFGGHRLTWADAAEEYPDHRLQLADGLYRREPGGIARR